MMKIWLHITFLIGLPICTLGQGNFVGQYSAIGPHGKDFLFKADSTFEIRWHTDLVTKNGKTSGTEYYDSLSKWTIKGTHLVLLIPNKNLNDSDTIFEIINENVIKRVDSEQKWFKTIHYDTNGNVMIEYDVLSVDNNLNFKDYNYTRHNGRKKHFYYVRNGIKQGDEWEMLETETGKKFITLWGQWDKGLKTGKWVYIDDEDTILREEYWKQGKEHGQWKVYNKGQVKTILTYKNGVLKSTKEL